MKRKYFKGRFYKDETLTAEYKKLAVKLHPDTNGGTDEANENFKEMNAEYMAIREQLLKPKAKKVVIVQTVKREEIKLSAIRKENIVETGANFAGAAFAGLAEITLRRFLQNK